MAAKAVMLMVIASVVIASMVLVVSATNHTVGGSSGWDLSSDIRGWSARTSFHAGDFLVFNYTPLHDVLEVNATEFAACKTIDPISAYTDGETVVPLSQPGVTRYFICGRGDHCSRGLKLRVRVLPKATSPSTTKRGGNGRDRAKGGRQPRRPTTPPPTHSRDKGTKIIPSPDSGAWGGKRDWMVRFWFLIGFLAVTQVILRFSF